MSSDPSSLGKFSGLARLFPLPNLVLFPSVVQPLHIFESRYRQLMADALGDDRLITMALLQPGWDKPSLERPAIHPVVCIGKIFKEEKLPDGRYNLLLHGLARARVMQEVPVPKLYRVARVELIEESATFSKKQETRLRRQLGKALLESFAVEQTAEEQLGKLLESPLPLGTLCDVLAFALPLDAEIKQELLAQADVTRRANRLLQRLNESFKSKSQAAPAGRFPPEFSVN